MLGPSSARRVCDWIQASEGLAPIRAGPEGSMLAGRWDKRRKKREPKHQAAWISRGAQTPPIPCVLCDISREGARLAPARFNALPDVFTLILSKDGSARRLCRI